jgi:hypothetical protein
MWDRLIAMSMGKTVVSAARAAAVARAGDGSDLMSVEQKIRMIREGGERAP